MSEQLPLALHWAAHQRFESFVVGANATALSLARSAAEQSGPLHVFIAGPTGSGCTHLLVAACAAAGVLGRSAQYLDLGALREPRGDAIRSFHGSHLLSVDNVDAVAGAPDSEHALFDLYNRCSDEGSSLIFAAKMHPARIGIGLPDLVSRLAASTQVVLQPLDEAARRSLLRQRAAARGIDLDEPVLDWLFARRARDLGSLMILLERIDQAALAAQRRVTVPFLRGLLAGDVEA